MSQDQLHIWHNTPLLLASWSSWRSQNARMSGSSRRPVKFATAKSLHCDVVLGLECFLVSGETPVAGLTRGRQHAELSKSDLFTCSVLSESLLKGLTFLSRALGNRVMASALWPENSISQPWNSLPRTYLSVAVQKTSPGLEVSGSLGALFLPEPQHMFSYLKIPPVVP